MAYYIENHQNITSCRKNPWEKLQAFPTVLCRTSIKAQWEKEGIRRERSLESHLFSCNVLTDCSIQRIRHQNRALDVVFAPGQIKNEKCLNEEGNKHKTRLLLIPKLVIQFFFFINLLFVLYNTLFPSLSNMQTVTLVTKGLCKSKSAKEQHLFIQNWLIQRHSWGIMGIISPTLCHKFMQHASEWQEQWPLSLPSPGWRWGGASWEADRQTGSYSWAQILQGGLTQTQATSNGI